MIKHSSKVKVDDLQGLILVTSVVASATDKSEELSEESQVKLTPLPFAQGDKSWRLEKLGHLASKGIEN